MYSDRENVNIVTELLVRHGVKHVVVCPGSRNAPLVHNFHAHPSLVCHPVTDERSAGFMALGIAQQDRTCPVAVCVTSGSALLNLMPAVAEASYQHCGFVVVSADRPRHWIDQLDGQTLPQEDALGRFVAKSVSVAEPHDDEERWYCNRLVNEAFVALYRTDRPVQINVPIAEPLFSFSTKELPPQRVVRYIPWDNELWRNAVMRMVEKSSRPMVVMGQMPCGSVPADYAMQVAEKVVMLYEPLAIDEMPRCLTDEMLAAMTGDVNRFMPDLVLYLGNNTVSKRLRQFLRRLPVTCNVVMVDEEGELKDVSMHTDYVLHGRTEDVVRDVFMSWLHKDKCCEDDYLDAWKGLYHEAARQLVDSGTDDLQAMAVKYFEDEYGEDEVVHYANSTAIRLGCRFASNHYIYCNRGLNGIEGSLSTAAGASLVMQDEGNVYCVIGDLSFFYDENALWQTQLTGNLRILLLNNGGGSIFRTLKGLDASPARDVLVAAQHGFSAEGVCRQFGLTYRMVDSTDTLADGIQWLGSVESKRPVVLEVKSPDTLKEE